MWAFSEHDVVSLIESVVASAMVNTKITNRKRNRPDCAAIDLTQEDEDSVEDEEKDGDEEKEFLLTLIPSTPKCLFRGFCKFSPLVLFENPSRSKNENGCSFVLVKYDCSCERCRTWLSNLLLQECLYFLMFVGLVFVTVRSTDKRSAAPVSAAPDVQIEDTTTDELELENEARRTLELLVFNYHHLFVTVLKVYHLFLMQPNCKICNPQFLTMYWSKSWWRRNRNADA